MTTLPAESSRGLDPLAAYYLLTPIFAIADFGLGWPVRVSGLDDPTHRGVYYVVAFGLGLLCRSRPASTPWVGMLESAFNVLLLILAVMLPIWALPDAFMAGEELRGPFDQVSILNFLLSGGALVVSFHRHQLAALRGLE